MVRGKRRICSCALHEHPRQVSYQVYQEHQDRLRALESLQDETNTGDQTYFQASSSANSQNSANCNAHSDIEVEYNTVEDSIEVSYETEGNGSAKSEYGTEGNSPVN